MVVQQRVIPIINSPVPKVEHEIQPFFNSLGICTQCRRKLEESSPIESIAQESAISPIEDQCGPELEEDISENIAKRADAASSEVMQQLGDSIYHLKIEDYSPCQPDSQLDDSICHLTIEEENLSQPDSTLGDLVYQLTTEETSLYQPNSQSASSETSSGSDTPTTSLTTKRLLLNDFLRSCDTDTVGPYKRRWEEATVRTRANHVSKAKSVIVAGLNVIAPGDAGYLWEAVRNSGSVEKELVIGEPEERKYLVALAESYENASSWETRRQILSIMADLTTFKHIQSYIPGLTEYRFKMARQHSLQYGRGVEVPGAKSPRMKTEKRKQLDHFLTYITSPHVIKDIPFGQRYLRLSSGKILETPNVIRTMIPSRLVKQYQTYCVETDFTPFSPATMLRVLSACAATTCTRKSLQGLDYVAADGAKGFEDLCSMVEQLKEKGGLDRETAKGWEISLKEGKEYLKADYKVHISECCSVADHCSSYALSDSKNSELSSLCSHDHSLKCSKCESISEVLCCIERYLTKSTLAPEEAEDFSYIHSQAVQAIQAWKAHQLRTVKLV
ncbi:uncharacterized protein LOC144636901 [Oculina patagonica]